jgi:small-conductance mechanosensitive channel
LADDEIRADFAYNYNGDSSNVEVFLRNKVVSPEVIDIWKRQMSSYGLAPHFLKVIQGEDLEQKIQSLKENLSNSNTNESISIIRDKQDQIKRLEQQLALKNKELELTNKNDIDVESIRKNIDLHFPQVDTFEVYSGVMANKEEQIDTLFAIAVKYKSNLNESEKSKLNMKLKKQVRIQLESQNIYNNKEVKVYNY